MKIIIIGGGDIATNGIVPNIGGIVIPNTQCDVRNYNEVFEVISKEKPDVVICTSGVSHVSDIAVAGVYYFKNASDFINASKKVIKDNIRQKGEFYVSSNLTTFTEF